jgi:hypothetical protein
VIEGETCCRLVTLNKINIHNTSCVLTCESLLLTCIQPTSFPLILVSSTSVSKWITNFESSLQSKMVQNRNKKFTGRRGSLHPLDINWLLRLYWICCSIVICFNEAVDWVPCLPRVLRFSAASYHSTNIYFSCLFMYDTCT